MLKTAALACVIVCLASCAARDPRLSPRPDDPASLQVALAAAVETGARRLVIPPGTWRIPAGKPRTPHLVLEKAVDLEVDGSGATLVFEGRDQPGLAVRGCVRTVVRGLRLERATPTCSQGVIERFEEDGRFIVVRIDQGYPQDVDDRARFDTFWTNAFTPDRARWLGHYRGVTPTEVQSLEPGLVRVRMNDLPGHLPVPAAVGTPLAWRGKVFDDVEVRDSSDCTIDGVTVAGGAGMCFHERGGGGNRYLGCSVVRAARPAGATQDPLLSSCADGFHSSGATRGPRIERCSFTAVDDDAIAIHGSYAMAMEARGEVLVAWRFRWEENATYGKPGDTLRFYDQRGALGGEAVVKSVRRLEGYVPAAMPDRSFRVFQDTKDAVFLEYVCDRPVVASLNWLVSNPGCAGPGYVVKDCVIRDCYARGILPKGDGGVIEGNLIERTARSAIELIPELYHWSENDYSTRVQIRGNTIRNVGLNRQRGDLRHPGAITAFAFRAGAYVPAPGGHRGIEISGNTIEDVDGPNILITSAQGVRISGNRFVRPMAHPSVFGQDKGIDTAALVWCSESAGVTADGNVVVDPGGGMQRATAAGPGMDAAPAADGFRTEAKP